MKKIAVFISGILLGVLGKELLDHKVIKMMQTESNDRKNRDKFKQYYYLLNQWLLQENQGKKVSNLLKERGCQKIAIYGMGEIGKRLFEVISDSDLEVRFVMDQCLNSNFINYPILKDGQEIPEVDAVIVTIPFAYGSIKSDLEKKLDCPILSLEHILFEV